MFSSHGLIEREFKSLSMVQTYHMVMTIASLWQTYKYFMSFFLLYDFILFLKRT